MKLLMENWRQYVKKDLLSEVPLADFGYDDYDYPEYETSSPNPRGKSSVGYEKSKDPTYKDQAIKFFDQTEDLWYVVFLKTTLQRVLFPGRNYKKIEENSDLFKRVKQMQIDNNWDPKGKYIVVSFSSYNSGDESSPGWQIAHDIIGHTIEKYHQRVLKTWYDTVYHRDGGEKAQMAIYKRLPKEMQISVKDKSDRGPDIYAAIFLGKAPAIEKIPKVGRALFKMYAEAVGKFKDQIKEGEFWYFGGWN